jgi:ubiquinone/menaquinone biosynthesis C-methylase UbiE
MIDNPMSNLSFKFMSFFFKFRDFYCPPIKILKQINIQPGSHILDYGCGSGSYSIPAAQLVGPTGKVYAADIHPLAIREVQKRVRMMELRNVDTILTDQDTKLPNASIDIIFLFRVLHDFKNPDIIIKELDRVLKPTGILSVIDHKFDKGKVVSTITRATQNLKLRETVAGNSKEKNTMLIFSKSP